MAVVRVSCGLLRIVTPLGQDITRTKEATVSRASRRIGQLESSVETAQNVLDHTHHALSAIETAQEHAEHTVSTLRRVSIAVVIVGAIVAGLLLLRRSQ
jgi:hypothetical protein